MYAMEIDKALTDIVIEKLTACQSRLNAIPKENKNERKAVQIELGMYTLCLNAGLLYSAKDREAVLRMRQGVMERILRRFEKAYAAYAVLNETEKGIFTAALQAELFMRDQVYRGYRSELAQAKSAGDTERIFALQVKIGAVESVFSAWEAWRMANHVYPHMVEEGTQ